MTIQEKFNLLGKYNITLIQWQNHGNHWRLGLDRYTPDLYLLVVEKPTIEECLDYVIEVLNSNNVKLGKAE